MPVVRQLRGAYLETVHPFSAVAVQAGRPARWWGPPLASPWRSAAKPFQLFCALEALGAHEDLSDEQLAVGAASHSAEPVHVALVRGLLERYGLDEGQLLCGGHWPMHHDSGEALVRAGGHISDIHNNCSGKHTFMRAAAQARGWDADYRPPTHPLQARIKEVVEGWAGTAPGLATDGCGVPTFYLSIEGMARAWSALAVATAGSGPAALGRIGRAMQVHPELTSGTGRLDLIISRGAREPLICKIGAGGVFCMAFPQRELGVAVKVSSGSGEALPTAVEAALERLVPGAYQRQGGWAFDRVFNIAGAAVGSFELVG